MNECVNHTRPIFYQVVADLAANVMTILDGHFRIHQHVQKYLKNLNDPDVLVITAYAGQYTALNFSAVTVQYANLHRQKLFANIKAHRYSKVLVFQEIDAATNRPKWDNQRLDPRYKIKVVKNIQILNDRFLRISRLIR